VSVNLAKRAAELATEHWDTQGPDAAGYAALVSLLVRAQSDGAREERARIVAFLGRAVDTFTDGKHFEPKWSPATGTAVRDIIDAIERGEHEEKAND
jgi:hypothetical protein